MESEDCKDTITSPEEIKPKNPKRIEQGKKLAQWSRAAKERKNTPPQTSYNGVIVVCVGVATLVGIGYIFKDRIKGLVSSKPVSEQRLISLEEQTQQPQTRKRRFCLD